MRTIKRSTQFKKDFKRELKGRRRTTINGDVTVVADLLANDHALPAAYSDHALSGSWKGC